MSTRIEGTSGASLDRVLQCWNEGALSTPAFGAGDILMATVSPGEGRAALFNPTVGWWTAPDPVTGHPTQTGWAQGQVLLHCEGTDLATLDPYAEYPLEVRLTPSGSTESYAIWAGSLVVGWSPAAAAAAVPVYCSYQDLLDWGPWCRYVQDAASSEAGFYDQRLEARLWLDDLIVRSYRGSGLVPFGMGAGPYTTWSGWGGPWRSPMPSTYIRDQLWGGFVLGTPVVSARGSGYSSSPAVTAPPPPAMAPGMALAQVAQRQRPAAFRAVLDGSGGVGSVQCTDPGFGYVPGSTLTLSFSGGGGSGAAATAPVSAGSLVRRDQVRRIAAFKSLGIVGLQQIGVNPQHVAFGMYFGQRASEELTSFTAELDSNNDGMPDVPIPLSHTNTIYI